MGGRGGLGFYYYHLYISRSNPQNTGGGSKSVVLERRYGQIRYAFAA